MYPLNELSDTLTTKLWERALTIVQDQHDSFSPYTVQQVFAQLQRDVVTLIMDGLEELGESPAQKSEVVESQHETTQLLPATVREATVWCKQCGATEEDDCSQDNGCRASSESPVTRLMASWGETSEFRPGVIPGYKECEHCGAVHKEDDDFVIERGSPMSEVGVAAIVKPLHGTHRADAWAEELETAETSAMHKAEVDGALDRALWDKAGMIASDRQLDSAQRHSLHAHMRDGIEIGLDAFRKGE